MPRTDRGLQDDFTRLRAEVERTVMAPPLSVLRARSRRRARLRLAVPVLATAAASLAVIGVAVRMGAGLGLGPSQDGTVAVATAADPTGSPASEPAPSGSVAPSGPATAASPGGDVTPGQASTTGTHHATSGSRTGQALTLSARPSTSASASSAPAAPGPGGGSTNAPVPQPSTSVATVRPAPVPVALVNADFETRTLLDGVILIGSPAGWSGGAGIGNPSSYYYSGLASSEVTGTMAGPNVASVSYTNFVALTQRSSVQVHAGHTYRLTVAVGGRSGGGFTFAGADVAITADGLVMARTTADNPPVTGSFGDVAVTWTATASDEGKILGVQLDQVHRGPLSYVDYDNVRLTDQAP